MRNLNVSVKQWVALGYVLIVLGWVAVEIAVAAGGL